VNPPILARCFTEDLFRVYDFSFRLRTNHRVARRLIANLYRPFRVPTASETTIEAVVESDLNNGFLWRLGEQGAMASDLAAALWSLEASLCEAIIRSQRRCVAVHGATVCAGNFAAMLVGHSGAGKSTLSLALARRGFSVATDDVTLVDPATLNLLPIPRCFHLVAHSVALLESDGLRFPRAWKRFSFVVPSDLSAQTSQACRVRLLILITGPRAQHVYLAPISQAEMAARLLSETGQGPLADPETVGLLSRLAGSASSYMLTPGPLASTADAVADLILRQKRSD
jgi:hypothetical protein